MKDIGLCITDLNVGGAERCLFELATRIDRKRYQPTVYCVTAAPKPGETTLIPALESAGIEVKCLGARNSFDFLSVISRLATWLRERKTELLQTFLFHANIVGRLAATRGGVPHVVCGIRVAERGEAWHIPPDRTTHRLVKRYVCVSQSVADFCVRTARLPADKMAVIPNGIDMARLTDVQKADLSGLGLSGRRVVTFIGRLTPQKGLYELLFTARDWLPRAPDCDLLLVGEGPLEAALRRQCGELGIADRVHFAGWRPDIPAVLAASKLFVLASAWEGMPNVVLEAMAGGLPVAVTQVEGVAELLGPGLQEQSAPYGEWDAFSEMVVRILGDSDLARRLGKANRDRAEHSFTLPRMVASYEQLWEQIMSASG
jgi:glycosyltransferase involved in cell wall biosynthesis